MISGSPSSASRFWFSAARPSSIRRRPALSTPGGFERYKHRIAVGTQRHALVLGRQKAGAPQSREEGLAARLRSPTRVQHDKRRQILVGAADAVRQPGARARTAGQLAAGLNEGDRRIVVDRLGIDRLHDCNVIDDRAGMRQQLAQPGAVFAVLLELEQRRGDGKSLLPGGHCGDPLAVADRVGQVLVEPVLHLGLIVEQVELRRSIGHEQPDHAFRLGGEVQGRQYAVSRVLARRRAGRQQRRIHHRGQRGRADAGGAASEKVAASFQQGVFLARIHERRGVGGMWQVGRALVGTNGLTYSLVIVSSRLRIKLATMVRAASWPVSSDSLRLESPTASNLAAASGLAW